jgi:perosamine synthetase
MTPMNQVPLSKPEITEEDISAVTDVMRSGQLAFGEQQSAFEEEIADYCGVDHAVAVSSGTAALHLATELAGISQEDEVIVSPFSFIASSNVVLYQKAKPVFVDIEEETLGMNPLLIEEAISAKTKAVLPTHVFGHPCKIEQLAAICSEKQLTLIEDNCESLGAEVFQKDGVKRKTGQFGAFTAYGFYPNKLLTTGEGGVLTCRNPHDADRARSLRNQGRSNMSDIHLVHDQLGFNYRMSDIQSALGRTQLSRIEPTIIRRRQLADYYNQQLKDVPGILIPKRGARVKAAWFVYYVRVDQGIRDGLIQYLYEQGIQTRPYFYPPIHLQPFYMKLLGTREGDFPVAEKVSKEIIALPFFNQLTESQIDRVVDSLVTGLGRG